MNFLKISDPLNNEICFDAKSIGLAIVNSEINSFTHDIIRNTLRSPTVILEIDPNFRIYIRYISASMIQVVNVILINDYWYVKDVDLETKQNELFLLIQKNKIIYKMI